MQEDFTNNSGKNKRKLEEEECECLDEESMESEDDWQGYIEGVLDHMQERIIKLEGRLEEFGIGLGKAKSSNEI